MLANYKPRTLADIIGQPQVRQLKILLTSDSPRCFLLDGDPGVGKSATCAALASDLGADVDWDGYLRIVPASELDIAMCRDLFEHALRLRRANWKMLVIEELDGVASKQVERYLKVALERLPQRTVIMATSNEAHRLSPALRERFRPIPFSSGPSFAAACQERIAEIWESETGIVDMPPGWTVWGQQPGKRFSMRDAMRSLEEALLLEQMEAVA